MTQFAYQYYLQKPVIIESQKDTRKPYFKNVFYTKEGNGYVLYHGVVYEQIGVCEKSGKMVFKKSEKKYVIGNQH